jgi:PAS domain S-box-containing protein
MNQTDKSITLLNVLYLEDVLNDALLIKEILVDAGFLVSMDVAAGEKEYHYFLKRRNYDIILADYALPGFDGTAALKLALELQPEVPFICVSGTIGDDLAVELLKLGATDYILKDRLGRLAFAVRRALEEVVKQKKWKKTVEALRESEEKYRVLFEGSTLGILATDVETHRLLYPNPAICKLFGYLDEEFLLLTIPDLHPKDSMDLVISEFESLMRGEKVISSALPCLRKDGTVFYADISNSSTIINGRKCAVGFIVDVTTRKQAEEMLQESKVKYQEIFESTGTATFICDENATILMANNECYSITGYTPTEIIGQKWNQYIAPESLPEILKNHKLRRENPDLAPKKHEVKLVNKKGEKRDVILNVVMLSGTKQSIVSILDITERKQAEEALLKLKKAIYTSGEAIFMTDIDGIFTFVNPAFTSLYGFSSEEIIGKATPRIISSGEAGKSFYEVFWSTLLKGFEAKLEIINKKMDGSLINIEASATPIIDEKKNIIGFLGIQHDISDRKLAEQELITAK